MRLSCNAFILRGLLALSFVTWACSSTNTEASENPIIVPSNSKDTVIECDHFYIDGEKRIAIPCRDTLEGYVNELLPIGIDSLNTSIIQLWNIGNELFALDESGSRLWSKTHGTTTWKTVSIPNNGALSISKPIFSLSNQKYVLAESGEIYSFSESGFGKQKIDFNLPSTQDACLGKIPCYYGRIDFLGKDFYAFAYGSNDPDVIGDSTTFLYKSLDSGKTWNRVKDYPNNAYLSDWIEFGGYAYTMGVGDFLQQFNGVEFKPIYYKNPQSWNAQYNYSGFVSIKNKLFTVGGSTVLEIKGETLINLFDGYFIHPTIDTLCGSLINTAMSLYWNPDSSVNNSHENRPNASLGGYRFITDNSFYTAYKHIGPRGQSFSPVRIGDTLYLGSASSAKYGTSGGVYRLNLRNVKVCPDAWERGNTIGGRTK